jgi:signal peptidase I
MKRKEKSVTQSYIEVIIVALVVALGLRAFLAQAYEIPTKSMEDSLWAGDFVLVNKLTYNFTDPKPGDIIVFKYPLNPSKDFIKRCIATEGQTVQIIDKELYVDGKRMGNAKHLDDPRWEKFSDPQTYPTEYSNRDNFGPVQVPPGQFFVLGDNRDNSQDSRDWGFLDRKYIKGKAFVIYWSWKQDANAPRFESPYIFPLIKILFHYLVNFPTHIRWERIGRAVK